MDTSRWKDGDASSRQIIRWSLRRPAAENQDGRGVCSSRCFEIVLVAEPARIVFQRDLNGNGVIDPTRERVSYLLRSGETTLRRDAGGGAQPIAEGVRRFALSYLDRDGLPTADRGRIVSVKMELEVGRAGPEAVVATLVTLRNVPVW